MDLLDKIKKSVEEKTTIQIKTKVCFPYNNGKQTIILEWDGEIPNEILAFIGRATARVKTH